MNILSMRQSIRNRFAILRQVTAVVTCITYCFMLRDCSIFARFKYLGYFFLVFTARIQRMGEGNVFSLFTPGGYPDRSGGVPQPDPDRGTQPGPDRGYPSQIQMGGTPVRDEVPPSQVRMGIPQSGMGYPLSSDGVPPCSHQVRTWGTLVWDVVPPVSSDGVPPRIGQQMQYLICGGRYASCVHAGGLSCFSVLYCSNCSSLGQLDK